MNHETSKKVERVVPNALALSAIALGTRRSTSILSVIQKALFLSSRDKKIPGTKGFLISSFKKSFPDLEISQGRSSYFVKYGSVR